MSNPYVNPNSNQPLYMTPIISIELNANQMHE